VRRTTYSPYALRVWEKKLVSQSWDDIRQVDRVLAEVKAVDRTVIVHEHRETEREQRGRLYLHEIERHLNVYLCGDHSQEIYRGLRHKPAK